jgi:hypothetical protein
MSSILVAMLFMCHMPLMSYPFWMSLAARLVCGTMETATNLTSASVAPGTSQEGREGLNLPLATTVYKGRWH